MHVGPVVFRVRAPDDVHRPDGEPRCVLHEVGGVDGKIARAAVRLSDHPERLPWHVYLRV